jgi:hypothetical protein
MTISSNTRQAGPFTGTGSASTFAFSFKVFSEADVVVIKTTTATGTDSILTITTDYTVDLNENQNTSPGGSITLVAGNLASGYKLTITSDIDNQQPIDLTNQGGFYPSVINDALDRVTIQVQQVDNAVERSVKFPISDGVSGDILLPNIDVRKGTVLAFNDTTGLPEAGPDIASVGTVAGNVAAINSVAGQITPTNNVGTVAGVSGDVSTVAGIQAAVTTVANNDANVTTCATNIAAINDAPNQASAAAGSATAAAGSASAAATSALAASNSESAAAAIFDNFDDAYLGAKATNPSVDNDGDALEDGALYFDTTNNVMKVFDLGSTTWFQLTPTVAAQTNINTVANDIANVNSVATNISNVNSVAGNESNINAAVSNASNINAAVSNESNINAAVSNQTNINAVVADAVDIGTVATNIANVNNVGGSIANVNNVAANLASVNAFGETYFIAATAPSSPTEGDLWFDTTAQAMKVYGSGGWQLAGSSINGTSARYDYVVGTSSGSYTGSTTTFPATYDSGYVDVYLNGIKLKPTTDFTATSGTQVVLSSAATSGDEVAIVGYGTFDLANFSVGDANDVDLSSLSNGDALVYSSSSTNFEPVAVATQADLTTLENTVNSQPNPVAMALIFGS